MHKHTFLLRRFGKTSFEDKKKRKASSIASPGHSQLHADHHLSAQLKREEESWLFFFFGYMTSVSEQGWKETAVVFWTIKNNKNNTEHQSYYLCFVWHCIVVVRKEEWTDCESIFPRMRRNHKCAWGGSVVGRQIMMRWRHEHQYNHHQFNWLMIFLKKTCFKCHMRCLCGTCVCLCLPADVSRGRINVSSDVAAWAGSGFPVIRGGLRQV